jgi:hypothetical protein
MSRRWEKATAVVALVLLSACGEKPQPKQAAAPAGPTKGTKEWKIENAMSAAPGVIANGATIMDWPSSPNGPMTQLRAGTNGWTCISDIPNTPTNDPFCWDAAFGEWVGAWMAHKPPHITKVGLAYMLQGATDASNTDPFKGKPDSGQEWVTTAPHVMIVVPDPRALAGMSTDWKSGGAYVMFAGTPWAHIMMPVAAASPGMTGMN